MVDLLDFLFPKTCAGCGREGELICQECLQGFPRAELVCPMCERPAVGGAVHPGCGRPFGMDGLVAVWKYEGKIKKVIGQMKFKFVEGIAIGLANGATAAMGQDEGLLMFKKEAGESSWVGVPLHFLRERWRGFSQAEELARPLAGRVGGKFASGVVVREQFTVPQVGLKEKVRRENIAGVFRVTGEIGGRNFVLVDDVWTTGATMKEVIKVLKRHGARSVWGFVLAR